MTNKKPLIIGVGGLLEQQETGRIQDLLAKLQEIGCITYSVRFSTICRDGNTILCPMSPRWVDDFNATVETALNDERVNTSKIGIIASSIGATIADYSISRNSLLAKGLGPYAAISPLARPHTNAINGINYLIRVKRDLDVSFPHDKERELKRVIPYESLEQVRDINTPIELAKMSRAYSIKPLTIIGLNDDRCDIEASRERHKSLEGAQENLLEYNEGHSVPAELTEKPILDFMGKELLVT